MTRFQKGGWKTSGEEDKFYIRDHHEPIISEEIFEEAQKILAKRNTNRNVHQEGQKRNKFSRKYAFSCMIKCGFCGGTLTRRNWHSNSAYTKTIWQCVTATKNGKRHCPHCKGIPEEVIEKAFVKSYQLLCTDQQEIVDEFLQKVEGILNDDTSLKRLPKIEKEMADLHRRKEKLLDLRLDNNIDRDIYEKKNQELSEQLKKLQEEQERLMELGRNQDNTRTRLREFRKVLGSGEILESFDRVVFESAVEKIIIGGYNDEGVEEPLKITFVYKTGIHSNFNGKDFKPKRKNAAAIHNDAELCSYTSDEAEKLCLHSSSDTCRECGAVAEKQVKWAVYEDWSLNMDDYYRLMMRNICFGINDDQMIKLTVKSGLRKSYLYKSKAYKQNDTATIEADTLELSRLILDGRNIGFEELTCKDQELQE